ncbi:MAG: hypothetical protein ABJC19_06590 [Gemmatimonadota bacterium]
MKSRLPLLALLAGLAFVSVPQQASAQAPMSQSAALPGPRLAPQTTSFQYQLPGEVAKDEMAQARRRQTFTISTLALVLGVILLVVLIA